MRFDLGDLILDDSTRELLRDGDAVRLSPKAFDFLALLVRERPRVVTKAELHSAIWAGVFVSDASIAVVAGEVRAALGESAKAPKRIRTAHGHGYAYQGEAVRLDVAPAGATSFYMVIGERVVPLRVGDNIVGREPGVEIWIDSPLVSRKHAAVRVNGDTVTVEDLGSKNGTHVNQAAITRATVANGDAVRFGGTETFVRQSNMPTVGLAD